MHQAKNFPLPIYSFFLIFLVLIGSFSHSFCAIWLSVDIKADLNRWLRVLGNNKDSRAVKRVFFGLFSLVLSLESFSVKNAHTQKQK